MRIIYTWFEQYNQNKLKDVFLHIHTTKSATKLTWPLLGSYKRSRRLTMVLFPLPLRPTWPKQVAKSSNNSQCLRFIQNASFLTIATTSFSRMDKFMPCRVCTCFKANIQGQELDQYQTDHLTCTQREIQDFWNISNPMKNPKKEIKHLVPTIEKGIVVLFSNK